jgi:hypothetical protein
MGCTNSIENDVQTMDECTSMCKTPVVHTNPKVSSAYIVTTTTKHTTVTRPDSPIIKTCTTVTKKHTIIKKYNSFMLPSANEKSKSMQELNQEKEREYTKVMEKSIYTKKRPHHSTIYIKTVGHTTTVRAKKIDSVADRVHNINSTGMSILMREFHELREKVKKSDSSLDNFTKQIDCNYRSASELSLSIERIFKGLYYQYKESSKKNRKITETAPLVDYFAGLSRIVNIIKNKSRLKNDIHVINACDFLTTVLKIACEVASDNKCSFTNGLLLAQWDKSIHLERISKSDSNNSEFPNLSLLKNNIKKMIVELTDIIVNTTHVIVEINKIIQ